MLKKTFYISVFLIFILFLSSCTGGLFAEEELIKSVIEDYFSALSNKEWGLAQSYCIYGSDSYNSVIETKENVNNWSGECNSITLNCSPDILKVNIETKNALASGFLAIIITYDDREPHEETGHFAISLQKKGNSWKLLVVDFSSSSD